MDFVIFLQWNTHSVYVICFKMICINVWVLTIMSGQNTNKTLWIIIIGVTILKTQTFINNVMDFSGTHLLLILRLEVFIFFIVNDKLKVFAWSVTYYISANYIYNGFFVMFIIRMHLAKKQIIISLFFFISRWLFMYSFFLNFFKCLHCLSNILPLLFWFISVWLVFYYGISTSRDYLMLSRFSLLIVFFLFSKINCWNLFFQKCIPGKNSFSKIHCW